jgi:hypothetical protein
MENINTAANMESVPSLLFQKNTIKANGLMANKMEKVHYSIKMVL